MSLYGVGIISAVRRIHLSMRLAIAKKGLSLVDLKDVFKKHDRNGNGDLDLQEFAEALADFGIFTKVIELQALHKFYDINNDGSISS